ncbi:serine/threonine-protein kinase [Gloeocapsa sp. PCC 73106]|uniref:serine/threonine-protein kinase n=1 Tax=Gloeocapsa sp. PCC 73106 TaxID=102232 RepID=UPI0002AC2C36|nr:serine/threonine-protein kinase [Gloeocapsa sp. PCC 73106]ELR98777.1 protein kinase family protein [Gloeocapsa sp. PCC 73106]
MALVVKIMAFCLNPACISPDNPIDHEHCQGCGSELVKSSRSYQFKDYRVTSLLVNNKFVTIYLAEKQEHDLCVIKKLPAIASETDLVAIKKNFLQEVQKLYTLNHPQVPQIFSYFEQDNCFYLVENLIKGNTLKKEFKQLGRFNQDKIKVLLKSILPILKYLQQKNIVHQNIQPENIIRRGHDDSLILVNFAITTVKMVNHSQIIMPSYAPEYAAPEQIRGRPVVASDLYSLGVTCIRLLTGCLDADSLNLIYDDYNNCWIWQEYLNNKQIKIKSELACILNKMLSPALNERYQSAQEVINDLTLSSTATTVNFVAIKERLNFQQYWKHLLLIFLVTGYFVLSWQNLVSVKLSPLEAILVIITGCSLFTAIQLDKKTQSNQSKLERLTQENKKLVSQNLRLNFDNRILSLKIKDIQPETIIFQDNFIDQSRGWSLGKSKGIKKYIADGKYYFKIRKYYDHNYMHFSWIDLPKLPPDYNIELKTSFIEGEKEGWYGLILGTDDQNYYLFRLSRYGYARVSLFKEGKWEPAPCEASKVNCHDQMMLGLTVRDNHNFNYYISEVSSHHEEHCVGSGYLLLNCCKIGFFVSIKQKDKLIAFEGLKITNPLIQVS